MKKLDIALYLAGQGFHIFPLNENSKLPSIKDFPNRATRDPETIKTWWKKWPDNNIGISTSKFGDNEALYVIDVDNKGDKKGDETIERLEFEEGKEFPETCTQTTPSGGRHLIYRTPVALKQGANIFGKDSKVDSRSRGGFIVAVGSTLDGLRYESNGRLPEECPDWLVAYAGQSSNEKAAKGEKVEAEINLKGATERATHYLRVDAPVAIQGQGGDQTTFQVACRLKDFGLEAAAALDLMLEHWNDRCEPPWYSKELKEKVKNAYNYGREKIGAAAPEAVFTPVEGEKYFPESDNGLHPFEEINKEYAFITTAGNHHIIWETKDINGNSVVDHLSENSFHKRLAAKKLTVDGKKPRAISELWIESDRRRSYDGFCFLPGLKCDPRFYNLWRGFSVKPYNTKDVPTQAEQESLDAFLEHTLQNVCGGDPELSHWLLSYFAHLVQKPWEKPLTSLVFKGKKGTGKNALVERVGALLGSSFMVAADRRYLIGNFNAHLENMLFLVLDEAFWSGDKQNEGVLKGLITGTHHVIERKGKEPYKVENRTRVAIIGNEEWIVPASEDERRYAVFQVGEGRKGDRNFFHQMRVKMEQGGYRLLLRYLLEYDTKGVDINAAPNTNALLHQKTESLDSLGKWWMDCLTEGRIIESEYSDSWPEQIDKDTFRQAFRRYAKDRGQGRYLPHDTWFGRAISERAPSIKSGKRKEGERNIYTYQLPALEVARADWSRYLGHDIDWNSLTT